MANDTHSTKKTKVDYTNDLKGRNISTRGSISPSLTGPELSGVRKSSRETTSKKNMIPSSPNTRKSERLEKMATTPPQVTRKSETVHRQNTSSPLRRSERGKKVSSSCSSRSKNTDQTLGSSKIQPKQERKERSVKKLTIETEKVKTSDKKDEKPVLMNSKRMNARAYKALFKPQPKKVNAPDHSQVLNMMENGGERREEDSEGRCAENGCERSDVGANGSAENIEQNIATELFHPTHLRNNSSCIDEVSGFEDVEGMRFSKHGVADTETNDDVVKSLVESSAHENLQGHHMIDSETGVRSGDDVILSEKRNTSYTRSDAHDIVNEDDCTLIADATSLSRCESKNHPEACTTSLKKQRLDIHSDKEDGGRCNANESLLIQENNDRGELQPIITTDLQNHPENYTQPNGSSIYKQTNGNQTTCFLCKVGGNLLCCEGRGCKRSFHIFCLDPPLEHFPPWTWYCLVCVQKMMISGVYSVSEGMESIWDTRETEVSNEDGLVKQNQYFVKYKGLAHVHNQWVPESILLVEAPSLLAKFKRKNQVGRWKQEWTLPHRLLQKRLLTIPEGRDKNHDGHANDNQITHYEWLVKWRGLDYEHATWELESAPIFNIPEGQSLIEYYEYRRERAKRALRVDKTDCSKNDFQVDLSKLSAGSSSGMDNHLDFVKKLCSHLHETQNAVVYYDQERIRKVIAFIISLASNVCRPFLVICNSATLSLWDDELSRLAPSVDVVVYNGSKEIRETIRALEFYEERGWIMFQVLITSPKVLSEDLDVFEFIGWEAIVVDECQSTIMSSYFEQIKKLTTASRILLFSSRLKETSADYANMLSLVESSSDTSGAGQLASNPNDNLASLKARFTKYVLDGGKSASSRFVEYWVPAQMTNIQLEQYCSTLLSNSSLLCSSLKNDLVEGLISAIISIRKCCDHPYSVDESLQSLINKDLQLTEYLNTGIKASGKLQLFDAMLTEIKKNGLRVLVLFQPIGGSGRDLIGDILDDYLRQRFGPDSYERVDRDIPSSRKHSATNKFNKESERFVFLLETRACHPSIKLSSVDTVIIFDSNWSPVSDFRALQKITFDSKFEQMKIFRLYSFCTIEEKILVLAKQNKAVDNNLQSISRSTNHMLLMWGVSHLFDGLAEFHNSSTPASNVGTFFQQSVLEDVVQEFLTILIHNGVVNDKRNIPLILEAKQNQGAYSTDFPLFGEQNIRLENILPHIFWRKLLVGKHPQWKYCSVPLQRNRKRVQPSDVSEKRPEVENDDVGKKRRKVVSAGADPSLQKPSLQVKTFVDEREKSGTPVNTALQSVIRPSSSSVNGTITGIWNDLASNISQSPGLMISETRGNKLRVSQKNLHLLLKPEVAKLCEVLHLPEDIKSMVEKLLEYVMENHFVNRESATILQAFQISLCWTAASLLKYKVDHKESLTLAREHLNYSCKNEEAYFVYSLLRCLNNVFLCRTGTLKLAYSPNVSEQSTKVVEKDHPDATSPHQTFDPQLVEAQAANQSLPESEPVLDFHLSQKDLLKSIKDINKKCNKKMKKLLQKQKEEREEFYKKYNEEKEQLEKKKKMEAVLIRVVANIQMRNEKLKKLDSQYEKEFDEIEHKMNLCLKNLDTVHLAARKKLLDKEAAWVEGVREWAQNEIVPLFFDKPTCQEVDWAEKLVSMPATGMRCSETCEIISEAVVACHDNIDREIPIGRSNSQNDKMDTVASDGSSDVGVDKCNETDIRTVSSGNAPESAASLQLNSTFNEITEGTTTQNGENVLIFPELSSGQGVDNTIPLSSPLTENQFPNGDNSLGVSDVVRSTGDLDDTIDFPEEVSTADPNELRSSSSILVENQRASTIASDDHFEILEENGESFLLIEDYQFQELPPNALVQSVSTSMQGGSLPSDETLHYSCLLPSTSTGIQVEDLPLIENHNISQEVEPPTSRPTDFEALDQSNNGPAISDQALRQISSPPSMTAGNQVGATETIEIQNISPPVVPALSHAVGSIASDQSIHEPQGLEVGLELQQLPPIGTPSNFDLPAGSGHVPQTSGQLMENHIELRNRAVLRPSTTVAVQPPIDTSVGGVGLHVPSTRTPSSVPPATRTPLPLYHDPLQNELERIRKETDKIVKIHEETKKRFRSDCEKEIEEVVSQIRRKYEVKLQEEEAEFLPKKRELDANHNKVLMNRILAEAFRSKCTDIRASSLSKKNDTTSTLIQELVQQSTQNPSQRPPVVRVMSAATGLPSVNPQIPATPLSRLQTTTSPAVSQHDSAPLLQPLHYPMSAPSTRPSLPTTVNPQPGRDTRGPAPHLQRFRPPTTATSIPALSRGMLSPTNSSPNTPPYRQQPTRVPPPSGPFNRPHQPETSVGLLSNQNSSVPANNFMNEVANQFRNTILMNSMKIPSDLGSNLDPVVQHQPLANSNRSNPIQTNGINDIVCLSDSDDE